MQKPFYKYDAVRIKGIDRLLCVIEVIPDYTQCIFMVTAEDALTSSTLKVPSDECEFVELGQMDLFSKNED